MYLYSEASETQRRPRDWPPAAVKTISPTQAVNSHQHGSVMRRLMNQLNFYIMPVLNVDGYHYSWTTVHTHTRLHTHTHDYFVLCLLFLYSWISPNRSQRDVSESKPAVSILFKTKDDYVAYRRQTA